MERALLRLGFAVERRRGSHVFYRHPDGRTTTVPRHPGRDRARPLVMAILDDIRVSPDDFRALLQDL
jgi:predicted RNA binding protein YcfA (HicA-like mRNA interferase family)